MSDYYNPDSVTDDAYTPDYLSDEYMSDDSVSSPATGVEDMPDQYDVYIPDNDYIPMSSYIADREMLSHATFLSMTSPNSNERVRWMEERFHLGRMRTHLQDTGYTGTTPESFDEAVAILVQRVHHPTREQLLRIALDMVYRPRVIHPHINFAYLTREHIRILDELYVEHVEDMGELEAAQDYKVPSDYIVWMTPPLGFEHLGSRPMSTFASPAAVSADAPAAVPEAYQAYLDGEAVADLPPPVSPFEDRQPSQPRGIDALRDGDKPLYVSPTADVGFEGETTEHME